MATEVDTTLNIVHCNICQKVRQNHCQLVHVNSHLTRDRRRLHATSKKRELFDLLFEFYTTLPTAGNASKARYFWGLKAFPGQR